MSNNLEIALRIKADVEQAKREVSQFVDSVKAVEQTAQTTNAAMGGTAAAINKVATDFAQSQRQINSTATAFTYAGRANFSLRDSLRGTAQQTSINATATGRLQASQQAQAGTANALAAQERNLERQFRQGKLSAEQYAAALARVRAAEAAAAGTGSGAKSARGIAQNFGWQLQDIAVQAQMGVNPMVILSQQGSQLVSVFNPLAGAAIAVAGALGGALLPSLFSSSDAATNLNEDIRALNESYRTLNSAQKDSLIKEQEAKQNSYRESITKTEKEIRRLEQAIIAWKRASSVEVGGATASIMGSSGNRQVYTEENIKRGILDVEERLRKQRTLLENETQKLGKSEQEVENIRAGRDLEQEIQDADDLIKRLREQADTYGLVGAELGAYVAKSMNATDQRYDDIVSLYEQIHALQESAKVKAKAEADAKRSQQEAASRARQTEEYVKGLERQAAMIGLNAAQQNNYTNTEKGLTGALLARAQAAQKLIAVETDRKKIETENTRLAELQITLLRAQGRESEASEKEFINRYKTFREQLSEANRASGESLLDELFDLEKLNTKLKKAQEAIEKAFSEQHIGESSINAQREAGLITQAEAQRRIIALHSDTYDKLVAQRRVLEELAALGGVVGDEAKRALQELDAQALLLETTLSRIETTLRNGIESGLTSAIEGLAKGTMSFRDAVNSLATTVSDAIIRMTAEDIAQWATGALFNRGENGKDSGESMKEAAVAMTASGAIWSTVAAQIQLAASSLAAANSGSSGGSAGSSGGGSVWGMAANAVVSYFAADGGHIVGPGTSTSDSIPAMLSNNEYVTRAAVVAQPGALDFLHQFNRVGMAALAAYAPVRHNTGGLAGYPAPAMATSAMPAFDLGADAAGSEMTNRIVNVLDPSVLDDYLKGTSAEKIFLNVMSRNATVIRRSVMGGN